MLNLDINFLFIILESCSLEFCGALLNHPIDLAHSFKGFKIRNKYFFIKCIKVEGKVEAQLSLEYRPPSPSVLLRM